MTSKQMGLERLSLVSIIIGYSFFHTPVCFCSSSRLVTRPHMNILSNENLPEPTQFMYSILDFLLKFSPTIRQLPAHYTECTHEHTPVLRTTPSVLVDYVQCWKDHTFILNHQAYAYLEVFMFSQLKRYV